MNVCAYKTLGTFLLLSVLGACAADQDGRFDGAPQLLTTPVALGDALMVVERRSATAFLLDATQPQAVPQRATVLREPLLAVPRLGHSDEALVLSAGVIGDREELQSDAGLSVVSAGGTARSYSLGSHPFSQIEQQPAGNYAVLLRGRAGEHLLQNLNELAVVNLTEDVDDADAVRLLTLPEAPRFIEFSENFELDGTPRELAVVLTDNMAAVLDLTAPEVAPVLVQLNTNPVRILQPEEALFDNRNSRIYVRSAASDDIFALRLVGREAKPDRTDFAVSIDIVAAGRRPTDLQLFELDGVTYLLVMAELSGSAVVVDVSTSRTLSVRLGHRFDHALVRYGDEEGSPPEALLWNEDDGRLALIQLSLSATALERSIESLPRLRSGVRSVFSFDNKRIAFVGHGGDIALVDPATRSVTPYDAGARIDAALLDERNGTLWLAPPGQGRVAHLDLETGATGELLLDDPVFLAEMVPGARKLAVLHDASLGHVTFVDLDDPGRASSVGQRGFLIEGAFE